MLARIRRSVASLLIVCIGGLGLPLPAQSAMLGTETALAGVETGVAGAGHARVAGFVDRADVRASLEAYGVDPADVQARVSAMTDEEAALVAARIDELPAGGIVGAIVFVFLVLLITDILGLTKIFPFTRSIQ